MMGTMTRFAFLFYVMYVCAAASATRSNFLQRTRKAAAIGVSAMFVAASFTAPVSAFGPTEVEVTITGYKRVELCDGKKPIMPGMKAALVRDVVTARMGSITV